MAIAPDIISPKLMTYEDYLAEGEVSERYEIIDGKREFMTNPSRVHQEIAGNIFELLRSYQRTSKLGRTLFAPCDILISRQPLRTRHPDVLFISHEQLAKCGKDTDTTPLTAAPELVVEVLSPSDTKRVLDGKIADYRAIGVRECWVINTQAETIEVLSLSSESANSIATYTTNQTLQSIALPGLTIAVTEIFTR